MIARVAVELALGKLLDYEIPPSLIGKIEAGSSVKVPLKGYLRRGIVVETKKHSSFDSLLKIHATISSKPILPKDLLKLALWMSQYYATPLDQVIRKILPQPVRRDQGAKQQYFVSAVLPKKGLRQVLQLLRERHPSQAKVLEIMLLSSKGMFLTELLEKAGVSKSPIENLVKKKYLNLSIVHVDRSPLANQDYFRTNPKKLEGEQATALQSIATSLRANTFASHLLYGITGSGKTEIYLQAIAKVLDQGKGAIVLVPEISLTTQTIEKFKSRFDTKVAVLHHRLSRGERYDEWHRIYRGEASIAIGARSAIFSPVQNLGLIIVDEEHDSAYKQSEEMPCYHARDVAVMRSKMNGNVVILGSATPSFESYTNAKNQKYHLNLLENRVNSALLPKIHLINMKQEIEKAGRFTLFSAPLIDAIKQRFEKGEQSILFLNRRGYHTSFLCGACGYLFTCPHCEKALTFHLGEKVLACHLCGYQKKPLPNACLKCRSQDMLKHRGVGTEHVEKKLHALFPEIRLLRIDGDTTRHKGSHEKLFRSFSTGKSDVLIGTQMITKGLHFPSVTLVAILNCDGPLQIPDFRASEIAFQLITQVAGRAGRGKLPGEVLLQTQMPENITIQMASKQNFSLFYEQEIESRKVFGFPPFGRLVKCTFSGRDPQKTFEIANHFRNKLQLVLTKSDVLHPAQPSGHPKVKDLYRFQLLIRGQNIYPICESLEKVKKRMRIPSNVKLLVDVDPHSTFF